MRLPAPNCQSDESGRCFMQAVRDGDSYHQPSGRTRQFVAASVANGDYPDAGAVLLDALRVLEREKREASDGLDSRTLKTVRGEYGFSTDS